MKRIFMILAVLLPAVLFVSCDFFGKNDNPSGLPSLTYEFMALSGQDLKMEGYIPEKYSDFKILFGDNVMEVTRTNDSQLIVSIPQTMKGEYVVSFESAGKNKEFGTRVQIYTYMGDAPIGMAFRADITDAHTILSVADIGENTKPTTKKWVSGNNDPQEVKFFNVRGSQVDATLSDIVDVSSGFFTAKLDNPRNNMYDMDLNQNDYTCFPRYNVNGVPVIIDKKTGYMFRIVNSDGYGVNYGTFQWAGGRQFVISPDLFGREFITGKLSKIDVPEIMLKGDGSDQYEEDFAPEVRVESINGQENLDIENSNSRHWVAVSPDDIYLNKERVLKGGSLSSISLPENNYTLRANPQVFACYDESSICIATVTNSHGIPPFFEILGVNSGFDYYYSEHDIDGYWNVYQFADKTILSAVCRNENLGDKLYDFVLANGEVTKKEFTVEESDIDISPISNASPQYPCVSNYEYYVNDDNIIFRRRIDQRGAKEKVIDTDQILCISASANAISLVVRNGDGMTLFMYDSGLNLSASMPIGAGHSIVSVCRLKD